MTHSAESINRALEEAEQDILHQMALKLSMQMRAEGNPAWRMMMPHEGAVYRLNAGLLIKDEWHGAKPCAFREYGDELAPQQGPKEAPAPHPKRAPHETLAHKLNELAARRAQRRR